MVELDTSSDISTARTARGGQRLGRIRWFLLGVEQVEDPFGAGDPGLQGVVHARDLGERLVELRTYWMNAWMLPRVIWPVATCTPPTTATAT